MNNVEASLVRISPTSFLVFLRKVERDKPKCWVDGHFYKFNSSVVKIVPTGI